jgi:hypothetical protein
MGCIVLLYAGPTASAQEGPVWDKQALKDSVVNLLSRYQYLHNQLNSKTDPAAEREFVHLFSNLKVQVINTVDDQTASGKTSIEDYIINLKNQYPDGLNVNLDLGRLYMNQPVYDRNNRYVIRTRVTQTLKGVANGKVFTSHKRVIYQIGFFLNNNSPANFAIYGIEVPTETQHRVGLNFSPGITGLNNSTLNTDDRMILQTGKGFKGGVSYSYFFSERWGLGLAAQYSNHNASIALDKFDALGNFDPNLSAVQINSELWFLELPACISFRTKQLKRISLQADLGVSLGIRMFENAYSSALNSNTGQLLTGVFSDSQWITKMNRLNAGFLGSLSLNYQLSSRFGLVFGTGFRQGFLSLDNNTVADYVFSKYQGQYNALWGAPGKTFDRTFFLNFGATFLINGEKSE